MKYLAGIIGGAIVGGLMGRWAAIKELSILSGLVMDDYMTTGALFGALIGIFCASFSK